MAYLNWSENFSSFQSSVTSDGKGEIVLNLNSSQIVSLLEELTEVLIHKSSRELRLLLPQEWILFWKIRNEGSRFLLSHPEVDEWVGIVALSQEHSKKVLQSLSDLLNLSFDQDVVQKELRFKDFDVSFNFSNLDLKIKKNNENA